jgi:hypothetical protein
MFRCKWLGQLSSTDPYSLLVTKNEDVSITGRVANIDLSDYQISAKILTRDLILTALSPSIIKYPNQNLPQNKGKFRLDISRNITKDFSHDEYCCYIFIQTPDNKVVIPNSLKLILRVLDNPYLIPV